VHTLRRLAGVDGLVQSIPIGITVTCDRSLQKKKKKE
jgi:hypothetical protein